MQSVRRINLKVIILRMPILKILSHPFFSCVFLLLLLKSNYPRANILYMSKFFKSYIQNLSYNSLFFLII